MIEWLKKYWCVLAGAIGAVIGLLVFRRRPVSLYKPPPPKPPPEKEPTDFVGEHKEEKRELDKQVDDMSRDELVDSINSEYD